MARLELIRRAVVQIKDAQGRWNQPAQMLRDDVTRVAEAHSSGKRSRQFVDVQHFIGPRGDFVERGARLFRQRRVPRAGDRVQDLTRWTLAWKLFRSRGMNPQERVDDQRIVHRSTPLNQNGNRLFVRQLLAIWSVRRERVETVDNGEDPCADRNVGSLDAGRVAGAIPVFVMMTNDRHDWIREVDCREDVRADAGVQLHLLELGFRELSRLVQDVLGNCQFAHVVKQRRGLDRLEQFLIVHSDLPCEVSCLQLNTTDVPMCHLVLSIDRHRQCFNCRQIQRIQLIDVVVGILHAVHRGSEREVQHEQKRHDDRDKSQIDCSVVTDQ